MNFIWRVLTFIPWLIGHFFGSMALGLAQGCRIGWWELKAKKVVRAYRKSGESIYDLEIWMLLREITFKKQRNRAGLVVCKTCKQPTSAPHCHHIKHVATHPHLAFTPSNLVGLCGPCHQLEHPCVPLSAVQAPPRPMPVRRRRKRLA